MMQTVSTTGFVLPESTMLTPIIPCATRKPMRGKIRIATVAFVFLIEALASAQDKPRMAIMPLNYINVSSKHSPFPQRRTDSTKRDSEVFL